MYIALLDVYSSNLVSNSFRNPGQYCGTHLHIIFLSVTRLRMRVTHHYTLS